MPFGIGRLTNWELTLAGYISVCLREVMIGIYRKIQKDTETIQIWSEKFKSVGIELVVEDNPYKYGLSRGGKIFLYDEKENAF